MQDFVWQQKAMTDNARHSEHQTSPRVSYLWAGAKKSATIMIADWVQGHAPAGGDGEIKYTTSHHFLLLYKIACKPRIYII